MHFARKSLKIPLAWRTGGCGSFAVYPLVSNARVDTHRALVWNLELLDLVTSFGIIGRLDRLVGGTGRMQSSHASLMP